MRLPLALGLLLTLVSSGTSADEVLPYSTRQHGYSGVSSTVRGDTRTLGMAGATAGLADTFLAAGENPAGMPMTFGALVEAQRASTSIHDGDLQPYDAGLDHNDMGIAAVIYPWGFSLGYWQPYLEAAPYLSPSGQGLRPEVSSTEYRLSAARLLAEGRISVGARLTLGHGHEELGLASHDSAAMSGAAGVLIQLPARLLLGGSFSLPFTYPGASEQQSPGMPNFFQPIHVPYRLSTGVGWIPNRNFEAGASFELFGPTPGSALLRDDGKLAGESATLQPRLGFTYNAMEFEHYKGYLSGGFYQEFPRVRTNHSRTHVTGGLELNVYVANLGFALDRAPRYENMIIGIGLDIIRVARALDIIPPERHPPPRGFFPHPFQDSDAGLPRALSRHYEEYAESPEQVIEITKEVPGKIRKKAEELRKRIRDGLNTSNQSRP